MQRSRALRVVQAAVRARLLVDRKRRVSPEPEAGASEDATTPLITENDLEHFDPHSMPTISEDPRPWWRKDLSALHGFIFSSWINVLLLCFPLGIASHYLEWPAVARFSLNFFSLVPLAMILGDITEELAIVFGDVVGGLINATFGNVVELILSIAALQQGLYTVVATSLLGSILSNLLFVLGACFIYGGSRYKTQKFNDVANRATSSLLFFAVIGILLPTAAAHWQGTQGPMQHWEVLQMSRGTAVVLLLLYFMYLGFQLHTHQDLFMGEEVLELQTMSVGSALACLGGVTIMVAASSEFLTKSIEEFSGDTGIPEAFVGMIILPIAGNACEHITAVIVAGKNKMDLALGIAIGSSIQIAIFAIPFVVLVGWATGHDFDLNFDSFATLALTVSVIHANFVTADATSHWLMGVQLLATYVLIAIAFLYR